MSWLDNVMGTNNPSDSAMPYYNQIPGTLKQYYDPYVNMGQRAMGSVEGQYNNLMNDPTAMMKQIGSGYKASPGYQWQVDQATKGANQAAAAGGMVGSPAEQQQLAQTTTGLANQDYYNYMNQALGQYQSGLQGMGQLNQMGFNAAQGLAGGLSSNLMNQGNMAYAGTANQNQQRGQMWGNIFGAL
jgi:hypothetical protein